jgi:uncharacterized protein YqeY
MLKEQILDDIKSAMKSKENFKRDTLRFLHAAIKQVEIDKRIELNDGDIIQIIQKSIKQRNDSISQYKEANRDELVEKEENEIKILEQYLPKQVNDEELKQIIKDIIKDVNATSKKDMKNVMSKAREILSGQADGKRISQMVGSLLN